MHRPTEAHRPSFTELRKWNSYPSGPDVGTARHRRYVRQLRPDTITGKKDAFAVTPYTSSPSVRPEPVRRIYERVVSARGRKWNEPNRSESPRVTYHESMVMVDWYISNGTSDAIKVTVIREDDWQLQR